MNGGLLEGQRVHRVGYKIVGFGASHDAADEILLFDVTEKKINKRIKSWYKNPKFGISVGSNPVHGFGVWEF